MIQITCSNTNLNHNAKLLVQILTLNGAISVSKKGDTKSFD